ncbi:MAG TPA: hypothetical protein VLH40_05475, partial [Atribacteraceae bacterium]|nr:hypothetical protein [Atribacteraceae bacterium]
MAWKNQILTLVMAILLVLATTGAVGAAVATRVLTDVYVLPVAELQTTKTVPDIIEIENDLILVRLLPNRGRIVSDYVMKAPELPVYYRQYRPDPMVLPGALHSVEFGGYYLSVPWNTRDRQPFDLEYKIVKDTPEVAEVLLYGRDMFTKTLTEALVRVVEGSSVVEIAVTITNTSTRREAVFDLSDYAVFYPVGEDTRLLLPVSGLSVLESLEGWLGEPGTRLAWPEGWSEWRALERFVSLRSTEAPLVPAVGMLYPDRSLAFIQTWEPADLFQTVGFWTWGNDYAYHPGADAYFVVSGLTEGVTLAPEESLSFTVRMSALSGVEGDASLDELIQLA